MPAISRGLCLLFLELNILLLLLAHSAKAYSLPEAEQYAEQLAQQRLFAGMLHVDQGNVNVSGNSKVQTNKQQQGAVL